MPAGVKRRSCLGHNGRHGGYPRRRNEQGKQRVTRVKSRGPRVGGRHAADRKSAPRRTKRLPCASTSSRAMTQHGPRLTNHSRSVRHRKPTSLLQGCKRLRFYHAHVQSKGSLIILADLSKGSRTLLREKWSANLSLVSRVPSSNARNLEHL